MKARVPEPALWQRAIRFSVGAVLNFVIFGLGFAFLLTGAVTWRNRHALSERGVELSGRVDGCKWKSMFRSGGSGYHSCTYAYRLAPDGPVYDGYFQSGRRWDAGQPIPIRYLADSPTTSATAGDLEHPSLTAGAMMVAGVAWLGWFGWQARRRRLA